jgi:hypothetical protein
MFRHEQTFYLLSSILEICYGNRYMKEIKFWSTKIGNRGHVICSLVGNCVLLENLYESKFFLYEIGFYIINWIQLREHEPRLRNISLFFL